MRRTDIALRALRLLEQEGATLQSSDLAQRLDSTPQFIPQVLNPMVRAGWISSGTGPHGGYQLTTNLGRRTVLSQHPHWSKTRRSGSRRQEIRTAGTVAVEGHRPNRPHAATTLTDSGPTTTLVRHLVPTFAIAAAAAGIVEVLVARVGAPLVGFLAPDGAAAGGILGAAGRGATAATALLVVATTGLIVGWHRGTLTAIALPFGALVLTLTATANPAPGLLAASHLATAAAVCGLALGNQGSGSGGRTALTLGAVAVAAGQLSFLTAGGASTGLHRLAQAALILLPAAAAWKFRSLVGRFTWVAAGAGAVAMWAALAVRSPEMAMLSTWAIGATLAIPALTLVAAAAGWAALAGAAIRRPGLRLVLAGVVLLWVAGVQPTAVHHNLTGLLGVMVLAGLAAERNDASRGVRP